MTAHFNPKDTNLSRDEEVEILAAILATFATDPPWQGYESWATTILGRRDFEWGQLRMFGPWILTPLPPAFDR